MGDWSDLVYISTKNITFPKGLAWKLIQKFIGPYKILRDFKNQSFLIDLPAHLKQRGVHNVFHAALVRIHILNNDRLFPGWMDTQIMLGEDSEVLVHLGSGEEAVFQIQWKAGDITWLPHSQIAHLTRSPSTSTSLGLRTSQSFQREKPSRLRMILRFLLALSPWIMPLKLTSWILQNYPPLVLSHLAHC